MPRNVEIKARIASVEALLPHVCALADGEAQPIVQDDVFFRVSMGGLKLCEFADGSAELIHYRRPDNAQVRLSDCERAAMPAAQPLRGVLERVALANVDIAADTGA
jgi:hypothetical protein